MMLVVPSWKICRSEPAPKIALSLSPKLMSAEVVIPSVVMTPVTSMPEPVVASFWPPAKNKETSAPSTALR